MCMRMSRRVRGAAMRRARRVAPVLLIGLALAASLAFGFIPMVLHLYAEWRAGSFDPRLVDLLSLALNAALLIALLSLGRLRPHRRRDREAPEATD